MSMDKSHRLEDLDSDPFFGELQDDDSIEKELQNKFNLANQRYGETRKITKGKAKRPKALDLGDGGGRSRRDAAQSVVLNPMTLRSLDQSKNQQQNEII